MIVIAQTQLQSQIITLQSTVIKLLESALFTGNPPDMNKLYNASEFARMGTVKALRDQALRLQPQEQQALPRYLPVRGAPRPSGVMVRRTSSTPSLGSSMTSGTTGTTGSSSGSTLDLGTTTGYRSSSRGANPNRNSHGYYAAGVVGAPPQKSLTYPISSSYDRGLGDREEEQKSGPLFCPYAKDLQQQQPRLLVDDRIFSSSSSAGRGGCPACGATIPLSSSSSASGGGYKFEKEVVVTERVVPSQAATNSSLSVTVAGAPVVEYVKRFEDRVYILTPRFLAKCHRPGAESGSVSGRGGTTGNGQGKGYACYLCYRNRERDTLLKTLRGLVGHVRDKHDIREYEVEVDIRDVTPPRY